ncbi:signal peptidase II [Streptomyces sp. NPDC059943]|uniref:signal peptidase II n=1 Tax=Streptomyces sp. NPDC059943 TaxID=3347010 RepID=UPI003660715B
MSATDTPGAPGPAAAPGGAANAADGARTTAAGAAAVDDTGAPAGVGRDRAIGSPGAANAPEAPTPAGTADPTAPGTDSAGAGTATSADPAGTADANGPDLVSAEGVAAGTDAPDAADVGVHHATAVGSSDTGSATNAPGAVGAESAVGPDTSDTAPAPGAGAPAAPTRRLFWSTLGVAVVLLLVDQASKWWAVGALGDSESIDVVGDVIRFWLVYNPGAAFSMGTGVTWVFTIFAGVAVVAIAWYAWRVRSTPWAYALGLLLGGATSHFGDRLFREPGFARGHVVDFIDYAGFFVGNVADIGIFAGAVSIVVLSFKGIEAVDRDTVDNPAD